MNTFAVYQTQPELKPDSVEAARATINPNGDLIFTDENDLVSAAYASSSWSKVERDPK